MLALGGNKLGSRFGPVPGLGRFTGLTFFLGLTSGFALLFLNPINIQ